MLETILKIVEMVIRLVQRGLTIEEVEQRLENWDVPTVEFVNATVKVGTANARFAYKTNDAGRFIMQIWPADNSKPATRIQFKKGSIVKVRPEVVKADGGGQFYPLAVTATDGNKKVTLFIQTSDVTLAG